VVSFRRRVAVTNQKLALRHFEQFISIEISTIFVRQEVGGHSIGFQLDISRIFRKGIKRYRVGLIERELQRV
jgi:hypothetical protein